MTIETKDQSQEQETAPFYRARLAEESTDSHFYPEYSIITKTVDSVNSFAALYKKGRMGAKGGPSTHEQQDLYRAMLVFACAGLDIFVKQLIRTKLLRLIDADAEALKKFQEYVKDGMKKKEGDLLNMVAFALVDKAPREVFLRDYIEKLTRESQLSIKQLCTVSDASGLNTKKVFSAPKIKSLKDAFDVRHQIVHEMDINVDSGAQRNTSYRSRRQRRSDEMEKHTKVILGLACELLAAYKEKYESAKIEVKKATAK